MRTPVAHVTSYRQTNASRAPARQYRAAKAATPAPARQYRAAKAATPAPGRQYRAAKPPRAPGGQYRAAKAAARPLLVSIAPRKPPPAVRATVNRTSCRA
jgi:hypothetical protein